MKPVSVKIPGPGQGAFSPPIEVKAGQKIVIKATCPKPEGLEERKSIYGNIETCHKGSWISAPSGFSFAVTDSDALLNAPMEVPEHVSAIRLGLFTELECGKLKPTSAMLSI
jgi:hypothetical protein